MHKTLSLPILFSVAFGSAYGADAKEFLKAARTLEPRVQWQERSVLKADFTCDTRQDLAILGTQGSNLVVAVFINMRSAKPAVLEIESGLVAEEITMTAENQDFEMGTGDPGDVGPLPGFKRSKTCYGLRLDDERIDSVHIYWNRVARKFQTWQR
jgi:hypothetical protein